MSIILLKKHLDSRHQDIVNILNLTNHTVVSHAIKKFQELDFNVKVDKKFLEIFNTVDKKVYDYKIVQNKTR